MVKIIELETKHLRLRQWRVEDYPLYAKLTSNQQVMRFFPATLSEGQSHDAAQKFQNLIAQRGWGFWAVELKESGIFIGYAGLHVPATQFPFSPCTEIGWRVEDKYWDNGYVLEAGEEILRCAFEKLNIDEVVYFTAIINRSVNRIMEHLNMKNMQEDFLHPKMLTSKELKKHKIYKITKEEWKNKSL